MKNFTKLFTLTLFLANVSLVFAQATDEKEAGKVDDKKVAKGTKDRQNQTQFFGGEMEAPLHNFYRRKEISTPLQPSYDEDSAVYQKKGKREKQQQSYKQNQYLFPARPRDQWEIGVNFGTAFISGDVKPFFSRPVGFIQNFGAGVTVRKALGYVGSIRFGYNFFMMTGRNWEPDKNIKYNAALTGRYNPAVNYWNNTSLAASNTSDSINMNKLFFHNYRTYVHDIHLAGVVNVGNIRFHKERNMVNFYLMAGASAMMYVSYTDALDENGSVYDFSAPYAVFRTPSANQGNVNEKLDKRKEANRLLNGILDGKYESRAEHENNVFGYKQWQILPALTVGAGVQFHVAKIFTIGLEQRINVSGSDLLDGYRWQQDDYAGFTRDNDVISYTSLNLLFHVGGKKKTEPLFWLNPVHHGYKKLGDVDPAALAEDILKDDDDDGVPNKLDKEPETKKDCPVDSKGRSLDSDKDGVIDCDDKEPFSAPGYPIDSNGVAIISTNLCCDTAGIEYDSEGRPIPGTAGNLLPGGAGPGGGTNGGPNGGKGRKGSGGFDCAKMELPGVMFDLDKYYIDPQYYGNLHQIAERMQMCPDMKLVVTGFDESRNDQKFNEQLAWNRANAAVDYLVEKYGISRDRFIVKYQGGKKAATGTPYEKKMKNKVDFRYSNDGETGDSNPPAPHPGLKAGSNK